MSLKDMFFGSAPVMGVEDGRMARAMLMAQIGQGFMGSINNNVPGGIDMSSIGNGMAGAMQTLAQMKYQEAQAKERERAFMAQSSAREFDQKLTLGAAEDKRNAQQGVVARANEAAPKPEGALPYTYEEASNYLQRKAITDSPMPREQNPVSTTDMDINGKPSKVLFYEGGRTEIIPYPEGGSRVERPLAPYTSIQSTDDGGRSLVTAPRDRSGNVGEPKVTPIGGGVVDPSPPVDPSIREVRDRYNKLSDLAREYRKEVLGLNKMPAGPMKEAAMDTIQKTYEGMWPPDYDPLNAGTWRAAVEAEINGPRTNLMEGFF